MSEHVIIIIGDWLLILAAIPATFAPLIYTRVPWWHTMLGRHMMMYMVSLALVIDLGVLRLLIGTTATFDLVRLIAFAFVVVALWWRLFIIVNAQRKSRSLTLHDE